ncbi:beta-ketoacyl-[acyl-carrier-protein] synthase family protein [Haliangium sp.]|uniref:beta-ketoacyl-[acyl-carrier-protein] synthase family protein n=1 Tax=Haliangium sp. TaxID=2663208 RepID=UPI003D14A8FC
MRRRVFVVGVGAITPLGRTWPDSLARLMRGEHGVRAVGRGAGPGPGDFDADGFPSRVAAWIDERFDHTDDRRLALAEVATAEAWRPILAEGVAPERVGVFLGAESGRAGVATILALVQAAGGGKRFDHAAFGRDARALAARIEAQAVSPAAVAAALAGAIGARGPVETISLACASGLAAIVEGARALRLGECDLALCGGVGADVDPLMLVGFGKLGALSERGVSRPFDVHRDGFVVGEGAAMVVLRAAAGPGDLAAVEGVTDRSVEITGIGRSLDGHHLTAPDPDGDGAFRAMRAALVDAGEPEVGYVQAHGTSTPLNDAIEAKAIRRALGPAADAAWVSSIKGAVGHWIAGAGAVGALCAIEAVRSGRLVPTANLREPDRDCDLRHLMGAGADRGDEIRAALVNAFAFGGANASVVVERARP